MGLYQYVLDEVTKYIVDIQEREANPFEAEAVALKICGLAADFITAQISNALG